MLLWSIAFAQKTIVTANVPPARRSELNQTLYAAARGSRREKDTPCASPDRYARGSILNWQRFLSIRRAQSHAENVLTEGALRMQGAAESKGIGYWFAAMSVTDGHSAP